MKEPFDKIRESITYPKGFTASGIHCGIRKNRTKNDLTLIFSETVCDTAATYTQNKVKGAPLIVTKAHLQNGKAQAIICNSGNANTCNADGEEKAILTCKELAKQLKINEDDIVIASTGVIGEPINLEPIFSGIPKLIEKLSQDGATDAAMGIMTTDTIPKQLALSFMIGGIECRIGAIAKGSGMINPNMATMLCFITSDVNIESGMIQAALSDVIKDTFNMVSIDGDTSTNDMVTVLANGAAGNERIAAYGEGYEIFRKALFDICLPMSKLIATDGEGATKYLECTVSGAKDKEMAKICALSVINSPLVKTTMFGQDANTGRILCALGYSGADIDVGRVSISLKSHGGAVNVAKNGNGVPFDEELAKKVLSERQILIDVDLGLGTEKATAFGCDLTYDYVRINGDYRT